MPRRARDIRDDIVYQVEVIKRLGLLEEVEDNGNIINLRTTVEKMVKLSDDLQGDLEPPYD